MFASTQMKVEKSNGVGEVTAEVLLPKGVKYPKNITLQSSN